MNVNDASKYTVAGAAVSTVRPADGQAETNSVTQQKTAEESVVVTISDEAKMAALSNPGDWPDPPKEKGEEASKVALSNPGDWPDPPKEDEKEA